MLSSPNLVSNQRPLASPHVSDSLQKAVLDFEEALEKSSNRLSGSSQWTDTTIPPPDGFNAGKFFQFIFILTSREYFPSIYQFLGE